MMKRGQSWSMDLVIAVVVFGFIAVIFYSLLLVQQKPSVDELRSQAQTIQTRLGDGSTGCGPLTENQSITQEQLNCLYGLSLDELREAFGVSGQFCIYLEDADGIVYIANSTTGLRASIGDPALTVAGADCGAII